MLLVLLVAAGLAVFIEVVLETEFVPTTDNELAETAAAASAINAICLLLHASPTVVPVYNLNCIIR